MKAVVWRALMAIGMKIHHFASPKPPRPSFKLTIPSRLSSSPGTFTLVFYVPESYYTAPPDSQYPVVINFHGGGFTLGTGTDDARFAASIIENVEAVFVSVAYRLAPEHPFSVGVEDGADAVIYLAAHAAELRLDPHRMATSGFSAGGNFAFTVPLLIHELRTEQGRRTISADCEIPSSGSTLSLPRTTMSRSVSSTHSLLKLDNLEPTSLEMDQQVPDLTISAIVSFYPPTDFRTTRAQKRETNPMPSTNLPESLTDLFDESYLYNMKGPNAPDPSDPYLSPAAASDELLCDAYPNDIVLYTCEYDMLNAEGVEFGERLRGPAIHKTVHGGLIKGVPHGFDRKPNPLAFPKSAERCYSEVGAELKRIFGQGNASFEERRVLEESLDVGRFEDGDLGTAGVTSIGVPGVTAAVIGGANGVTQANEAFKLLGKGSTPSGEHRERRKSEQKMGLLQRLQ